MTEQGTKLPMTPAERQRKRYARLREAEAVAKTYRAKDLVDRLVDAAYHRRQDLEAAREAVERAILGAKP